MDKLNGYKIVWQDEFNYEGEPDLTKWEYEIGNHQWNNGELQAYTRNKKNVYIKGGNLIIAAHKENDGDREYTSSRLVTKGKFSWKYGYFEIRAKLPRGKGSWPAVWMISDSIIKGESWPGCGEIDIIEHAGRFENLLLFSLHSEIHNHLNRDEQQYSTSYVECDTVCSEFHIYGMEWTKEYIKYYVDDILTATYLKPKEEFLKFGQKSWPFDQPFFLIINLAIGGLLGGQEVDCKYLPFEFVIDYVRVYQKINS